MSHKIIANKEILLIEKRLKKFVSPRLYKVKEIQIEDGPSHLKKLTLHYLRLWFPRIRVSDKGKVVFVFNQALTNEFLWDAFQNQEIQEYKDALFFLSPLQEQDVRLLCMKCKIQFLRPKLKEMPYSSILKENPELGFGLNKSLVALAENSTGSGQKLK